MKQILRYTCVFFSIFSIEDTFSQELILWKSDIKLTWDNFKGSPDYSTYKIASAYIDINYQEKKTKDSVTFIVKSIFYEKYSWVFREAILYTGWDSLLLNHEQKHFDITEIYARKLRKVLSETHFTNDELLNGKSDRIVDSIIKLSKIEDRLYDEETEHGSNKEKQKEWDKKIAKDLLEWALYRKETFTVLIFK